MGNKLKRLLVLFVAFICAMSCMVGCGETENNNGYYYKTVELDHHAYSTNQTKANYNLELFHRNETEQKFGDPSAIFIEEGEWEGYVYATGSHNIGKVGFEAYRTNDFNEWEKVGTIYNRAENHFAQNAFWAPQLLWDETAPYETYNIDKEDGEDGTGLYFLFYSAFSRSTLNFDITNESKADDVRPNVYYPAVAISKTPEGPFYEYTGTNADGFAMDATTPLFNIEYINPEYGINLDENAERGQELYKERRSFIDACPYMAPDGTKYMYMARNRVNDSTNEVWGVKMKDWVTPDYTTVTRLTSFGWTTTEREEEYKYNQYSALIDEGPFMIYNEQNQKYYLTFSIGGTTDKLYPVAQAIGDTPLGPFTKIQPDKGGIVCSPGADWDVNGSGHHSFLNIGEELYIVYHTHPMDLAAGTIDFRGQAYDRVYWKENEDGLLLLHANGPTKTIQLKPNYYTGYENIASHATITATNTATGSDTKYLNDGLVKMHGIEEAWIDDHVKEFEATKDTTIMLSFDKYVTVRSLMIFNSYLYKNTFKTIKQITFSYIKDGKTGLAVIKNLEFDVTGNTVPLEAFFTEDELENMTEEEKAENYMTRPGGAEIVEFNELSVNKITIEVKKTNEKLCISDIVVLGKTA